MNRLRTHACVLLHWYLLLAAPLSVWTIRRVLLVPHLELPQVGALSFHCSHPHLTLVLLPCLPAWLAAVQDDGVNLEEWYTWLAAFTGLLCKKYG